MDSGIGERGAAYSNRATATIYATLEHIWLEFLSHLPLIAAGLILLLLTWIAATLFKHFSGRLLDRTDLRPSMQQLLRRLLHAGIWIGGIVLAAMVVFPGLTPTKAMAGLGLGSIAIGFAFKDVFSNFFAGVLILWKFPFQAGDYISCEGVTGEVKNITIRNTMIRTLDDELVVMPNAKLFNNPLSVLTYHASRRILVVVGIDYDADTHRAADLVRETIEGCPSVDRSKEIQVLCRDLAADAVNFEIAWWAGAAPLPSRESRDEVLRAVKKALDEAGIGIPYPQRTISFRGEVPLPHQQERREAS